jgi:hypothetical protein
MGEFLLDPAVLPMLRKHGGFKIAVSTPVLLKRLHESGVLTRCDDTRQRHTVRVTCEGHPKVVLAIDLKALREDAGVEDSDEPTTPNQTIRPKTRYSATHSTLTAPADRPNDSRPVAAGQPRATEESVRYDPPYLPQLRPTHVQFIPADA